MIDQTSPDLIFQTEAQVEAYAKLFLATSHFDVSSEFTTTQEANDFAIRRERNLKAQLDHFRKIDFTKANISKIEAVYHKISKSHHKVPLSPEGSTKASSRFNYKDNGLFRNQTVYFGKSKLCCEFELFHMDYQREQIKKAFDEKATFDDGELRFQKHTNRQYKISLDNILILSSKPSWDAINIQPSSFMNEWYDLNEEYEIPSSSQVLGTIARVHGLNGILYKSVRYQIESNLVVFVENAGELNFEEVDSKDYYPSKEIIPTSDCSIGLH